MSTETSFAVRNYSLDLTLDCGQAFRWERSGDAWEGVVQNRWVRLRGTKDCIRAETAVPVSDWSWLAYYLQPHEDLDSIVASFPQDDAMRGAVRSCLGLRLVRQDPWECLASFICSSTKQIVQIRQIISSLCQEYGEEAVVPCGVRPWKTFPAPERLACLDEASLRACKLGFRAPYLLETARWIHQGKLDLASLGNLSADTARDALMALPGVGRKIADCVLLFSYGFQVAFPVDVWIQRALVEYYFRGRRPNARRTLDFTTSYFGSYAGYAQQYLFHYIRSHGVLSGRASNKNRRSLPGKKVVRPALQTAKGGMVVS